MKHNELCDAVSKEIDSIVDRGISRNNLVVLGELVDIMKDLKNIEYWYNKTMFMYDKDSSKTESDMKKRLDELAEAELRYENSGSAADKKAFEDKMKSFYTDAKRLYGVSK